MSQDIIVKKTLIIGSDPLDYSGTQACRVLHDEGVEIVLVCSNLSTIMTDKNIANHIYIEPLTTDTIKRIIEKEKPDSIFYGLCSKAGLELCIKLAKEGFLEKKQVRLLGSLFEKNDKDLPYIQKSEKPKIIVLGCGSSRVNENRAFHYANAHCMMALKNIGYEVILINHDAKTMSSDFDIADRLYFEPLTIGNIMGVVEIEKPEGVIVSFGGNTALELAKGLSKNGVKIIGTSAKSIETCENKEMFEKILQGLNIKSPQSCTATTLQEALDGATILGYPVRISPSHLLGEVDANVAFGIDDIHEHMKIFMRENTGTPLRLYKYLQGMRLEVDAISDGKDVIIPGIIEHIEHTGVDADDNISAYPTVNVSEALAEKLFLLTQKICVFLNVRGLINIHYILYANEIYVVDVNLCASRNVPYISKLTGVAMCDVAARVSTGQSLVSLAYTSGIGKTPPHKAVKVPIFSFEGMTLQNLDVEQKLRTTGEVIGIGKTFNEAFFKALKSAKFNLKREGGVIITVRENDKEEAVEVAEKFEQLGFNIYATYGTTEHLKSRGFENVEMVEKIRFNPGNNIATLMASGKVSYILCTTDKGSDDPALDEAKIRRIAYMLGIPCLTEVETIMALADYMLDHEDDDSTELVDVYNF